MYRHAPSMPAWWDDCRDIRAPPDDYPSGSVAYLHQDGNDSFCWGPTVGQDFTPSLRGFRVHKEYVRRFRHAAKGALSSRSTEIGKPDRFAYQTLQFQAFRWVRIKLTGAGMFLTLPAHVLVTRPAYPHFSTRLAISCI